MRRLLPIFLILAFAAFTYSQTAIVVGDNVVVRSSSSERGSVHGVLFSGVRVSIIKRNGPWFLIRSSQLVGWIHRNSLRVERPSRSSAVSPSRTKQVVADDPQPTPAEKPDPAKPQEPEPTSPNTVTDTTPLSDGKKIYVRGPRGGCYYLKPDGQRVYVDHSFCK